MTYKPIYEHLIAKLTARAGTPVVLCASRPASDDRFTLAGVPLDISLGYILEAIGEQHGLPVETLQRQSCANDTYRSGVMRSGRSGRIATISTTRLQNRVLVDISRL